MPPEYDKDSPEWQLIERFMQHGAVSDDKLRSIESLIAETREAFILSNGVLSEKVSNLGVDLKELRHDVDRSNSNHRQEMKAQRQEIIDGNLERHDCKAEIEQKISDGNASLRREITESHPTWSEIKKIFVVAMFVMSVTNMAT